MILRIDGRFSALSDLDVLIDDLPAQLMPGSTSGTLFVRVPSTIAATPVAREVLVEVYSSDDESHAQAIIPAASPR